MVSSLHCLPVMGDRKWTTYNMSARRQKFKGRGEPECDDIYTFLTQAVLPQPSHRLQLFVTACVKAGFPNLGVNLERRTNFISWI